MDDIDRIEKKIDKLSEVMEIFGRNCAACQVQIQINTRRIGESGDITKDLDAHAKQLHSLNKWQWITTGGLAVLTFLMPLSLAAVAIAQKWR